MALKKITGTGRTGSRGTVLHRRPRRSRDWTPKDLSESKSHAEDFLHVLHDAPVCGPLPAPPSTSQRVIQGTKRGPALPPPPEFPQRWSLALKAPDPNSIAVARQMVKIGGSATEEDREAVIQHLAVFPPELLEFARKRLKTNLIACRNSVTDVKVEYRGVQPRGWPEGQTWDTVPGMADYKTAIIATAAAPDGGRTPNPTGHGSFNLVGHEFLHSFNFGRNENGRGTVDPRFRAARKAVLDRIARLPETPHPRFNLPYYKQPGVAGRQESHAETGCRWFYGDTLIRTSEILEPLADFWRMIERELGI